MMRPPRRALPTRAGLFALGAPIVLGVAAVSATNNLLMLILAASLGAVVLSGILSERNIRGVVIRIRPRGGAFAGEPARLAVSFERPAPAPADEPAYGLRVRERGEGRRWPWRRRGEPSGALLEITLPLLEGRHGEVRAQRVFARRGRAQLGRCELITEYPFGLLHKSRDVAVALEVAVRPRRVPPAPALADPRGLADEGELSTTRGAGLEVYGLREWEERDPPQRIHALRSAAVGREVTLDTAGIERPRAMLGVMAGEGADPAAFERALEHAAALLVEWDRRGYAVGLASALGVAAPGEASLEALLDALADLAPGGALPQLTRGAVSIWLLPDGVAAPAAGLGGVRYRVDGAGHLRPGAAP